MLREEDQREHTQDAGSADAAVLYCAGVALEGPDAVHAKVVESINAETFIESLKELRQVCKKFVMFLDNLSAHKAVKVSRYIESTDGDVILVYLPKYTPQLNPMEIQWKVLKNMTAQRCFNNAEELAKSIQILIDTGQILPVKQMDYMIP